MVSTRIPLRSSRSHKDGAPYLKCVWGAYEYEEKVWGARVTHPFVDPPGGSLWVRGGGGFRSRDPGDFNNASTRQTGG